MDKGIGENMMHETKILTQIKTNTPGHALQNKFEDNLTAPEAQELAVLKGANIQTIMDVYDALRRDADVGERIKRILEHE